MGKLGGEASIEIGKPIGELWEIVEDVASAPEWQDGLVAMNVIDTDSEGRVVSAESVSDAKVRTVSAKLRFTYDEPHLVSWSQEKGDMKSLEGAWQLEDLGSGRTKATYRLDGDPGRMLGMLVRGPVEGRIREILVAGRPAELRKRAGG